MKKTLSQFLLAIILCFTMILPIHATDLEPMLNADPGLTSPSYILYNMTLDRVILDKDIDTPRKIASLTKLMTAYTVRQILKEQGIDPSTTYTIDWRSFDGLLAAGASQADFRAGETISYQDALYGALMASGADAVQSLAYQLASSPAGLVEKMNEQADKLGMSNTHYVNTHGLDDEDATSGQQSTVADQLILLKAVYADDLLYQILTDKTYTTSATTVHPAGIQLFNVRETYLAGLNISNTQREMITGGKTGYTEEAGYCFAGFGVMPQKLTDTETARNDEYLYVGLGAQSESSSAVHLLDMINVMSYVNDNYHYLTPYQQGDLLGTIKITHGNTYEVRAEQDIVVLAERSVDTDILTTTITPVDNLKAPINKGTLLAEVSINEPGSTIWQMSVYATKSIGRSLLWQMLFILKWLLIILFSFFVLVAAGLLIMRQVNVNRLRSQRIKRRRR